MHTLSAPTLYFATDGIVSWGMFLVPTSSPRKNIIIGIEKIFPLGTTRNQNLKLSPGDIFQILTSNGHINVFCIREHLIEFLLSNSIALNVFLLEEVPGWRILELKETKTIPTMESGITINKDDVGKILVFHAISEPKIMRYGEIKSLPIDVIKCWYRIKKCDVNR